MINDGNYWNVVWSRPYGRYNKHHQAMWEAVVQFVQGKVLDLGCGPGVIWEGTKLDVTGMDFSAQGIEEAKKHNPNGTYLVGDVRNPLPFKDGEFDTVVMFGLLDYFKDWEPVLREARRVKKPEGRIIATLYNGFEGHDWKKHRHLTGNWYLYSE